jgi:hypothetical protein
MSFGANLSSGYTDTLNDRVSQCAKPNILPSTAVCNSSVSGARPVARYPSMVLASKICTPPTPSQLALYPKVAMTSSVRTQALSSPVCPVLPSATQRFSHYRRYEPPIPCSPLPAASISAGISKPSVIKCNIFSPPST